MLTGFCFLFFEKEKNNFFPRKILSSQSYLSRFRVDKLYNNLTAFCDLQLSLNKITNIYDSFQKPGILFKFMYDNIIHVHLKRKYVAF